MIEGKGGRTATRTMEKVMLGCETMEEEEEGGAELFLIRTAERPDLGLLGRRKRGGLW